MRNSVNRKTLLHLLFAFFGFVLLFISLFANQVFAEPVNQSTPTKLWQHLPLYATIDKPNQTGASSTSITAQGTSRTFYAVADAEVRQANPNQNFGIDPVLGVGYSDAIDNKVITLTRRSLLHFAIATHLPTGTVIHQAMLRLYVHQSCDVTVPPYLPYSIHRITTPWKEMSVTWNNQPSTVAASGPIDIPPTVDTYTFDVKDLVQSWVDGQQPELGLMLQGPEAAPVGCAFRTFLSKGGGGFKFAPELIVDYSLPAPTLSISQNELTFHHLCGIGASTPVSQILTLQSNDANLTDWTALITSGADWLNLSKTSGKLSRLFPDQMQIAVKELTSCPGTATAQIQVNAPSMGGSPRLITVTLEQHRPKLTISASQFIFSHQCGQPLPLSQVLTIQNEGPIATHWTATLLSSATWLHLDKSSGQVTNAAADQVAISVSENAPCPSMATVQLQIDAPGLENTPQIIIVTLEQGAGTLIVSSNQLTYTHRCGQTDLAPQTVTLQSNLDAAISWTATITSSASWLQLNKSSGQIANASPDQIQVSVNENEPCPGTVKAQVQIHAPGLLKSPQRITVTLQQSSSIFLPLISRNDTINAATAPAKRIVLAIGVADYLNLAPPKEFTLLRAGVWGEDLLAPRTDSYAFQSDLSEDNCMGGASCLLIKVFLPEELATKANVIYVLKWLDDHEDANTEVIIYVSGHGGQTSDITAPFEPDRFNEFLGVYDTNGTPQYTNHLLDDEFQALLANLETNHLVVILDTCNSGGMQVSNPFRAVLAASQENQLSWESSELEHGVFTYYLLQAMRDLNSDTNHDGWLSVKEAYDYMRDPVDTYVKTRQGVRQQLVLDLTQDLNLVRIQSGSAEQ